MLASWDIEQRPKQDYWQVSQKCCINWHYCPAMIYDNRAYFCGRAASYDRLSLGKSAWHKSKGWTLEVDKDPFDRSEDELAFQAAHFCYRCPLPRMTQSISEAPWVSVTNADIIRGAPKFAFQPFIHGGGKTSTFL
jgi:hypothetical protein